MKNESTLIKYSIFTRDKQYAYNVRNRLGIMGINLEYLSSMQDLLSLVLQNKSGIVLVDARATRLTKFIDQFAHCQCSKNFCFIFLDDNCKVNIECDNKVTYCSRFANILEVMPNALAEVKVKNARKSTMSEAFVDKCIINLFKVFKIMPEHSGYKFLQDCIKLCLGFGGKSYSILKDVYREVGKRYAKSPTNIEKSIRLAIMKSKEKNPQVYKCLFKGEKVSNLFLSISLLRKLNLFMLIPLRPSNNVEI